MDSAIETSSVDHNANSLNNDGNEVPYATNEDNNIIDVPLLPAKGAEPGPDTLSSAGGSTTDNGGAIFAEPGESEDDPNGPRLTQLIVNLLPYSLGEEEFTAIFEQFGTVTESRIIRDTRNGRSKGYGFIYYKYGADATRAIAGLDDFQLYHRKIRVTYAIKDNKGERKVSNSSDLAAQVTCGSFIS